MQAHCPWIYIFWSLIGPFWGTNPQADRPTCHTQNSTHPPGNNNTNYDTLLGEPTKTAHRQNGPNEGRKRPTQTKTAPMVEKTRPKRPQLTSKTAHYVTMYKYRINDIIKSTRGIPYKRVDAAAVVAAHLNVRRAWGTYSAIRCWGVAFTTWKDADRRRTTQLQPFRRRIWVHPTINAYPNATRLPLAVGFLFML